MKSIHIIVSGRVQGVYFRAFTQKMAVKYAVKGYVKNTVDGSVEIVACANQEKLDSFISECRQGPLMAKVDDFTISEYTPSHSFNQFDIY